MKNRVQLIGRVGQDPEVKNLEGGKKVATITIACLLYTSPSPRDRG